MSTSSQLEGILLLSKNETLRRLRCAGVEHCGEETTATCTCDNEELHGLLYSFCASVPSFEQLFELCDYYGESFDLVQTLVECNDNRVTTDVLVQLQEQRGDSRNPEHIVAAAGSCGLQGLPDEIDIHSAIIAVDSSERTAVTQICLHSNEVRVCGRRLLRPPLPFGIHTMTVQLQGNDSSDNLAADGKPAAGCPAPQSSLHHHRVIVTSATYRYVAALDAFYDQIYWGWEGNWTDHLEIALLELVVAVDEDLTVIVNSMTSMMSAMQGAASSSVTEMKHLLDSVVSDVRNALTNHSTYAVGRLHQTLVQFVEMQGSMGAFMRIPPSFTRAINAFILAKLAASMHNDMKQTFAALVSAAAGFARVLTQRQYPGQSSAGSHSLQAFLHCAHQCDVAEATGAAAMSASAAVMPEGFAFTAELMVSIIALKPSPMDSIANSSLQYWDNCRIDHLPCIPAEFLSSPEMLRKCARCLSETLFMDAIQLQSFLGYSMNAGNVAESANLICALLDAGFAYVASESGKVMALLPMERSMLLLQGSAAATAATTASVPALKSGRDGSGVPVECSFCMPPQLQKRAKDMKRVFRNNVKQPLSLRLNSTFDLALQRLREHHAGDCWVGAALEAVWRHMCAASPPQMLIFELWYGDTMIAADFAHPVNDTGIYVATRFFDRSEACKRLVPGFLLALVETKFLRDHGCKIWDLGTANLCPLMRYKKDLTGEPLSRPAALYELARAGMDQVRGDAGGDAGHCPDFMNGGMAGPENGCAASSLHTLVPGVLVADISLDDLLSDVPGM